MRSFKSIGIILGGVLALVAVLLIAVTVLVNPNDYKGRIEQEVKASTGRDLALPGDIKLSVFPWFALELGPLTLGNPPGFGSDPFLSVQRVALRVKLLPLLRHVIEVGRIEVDGLDLSLKKNAAGRGNWEDFGQKATTSSPDAGPSSGSGGSATLADLGGVVIKDARIGFDDLVVSQLNVDVGRVARRATVPVKASFSLATGPQAKPTSLSTAFDVALDTNAGTLQVSALSARLDETQLRGTLAITNLDSKAITFNLTADHIDLDRYRSPKSEAATPRPTAQAAAKPSELPLAPVRALDVNGELSVGTAKAAGLELSNLRLTLAAKGGVVRLFPIKANLYGGEYSGDITYDAHDSVPRVELEQQVSGVNIAPLLKDSIHSARLSGRGNASARLAGAGLTGDALIRNLSGKVEANLADGALTGINLWSELNRALALLKRQPAPTGSDDRSTKFDTFKASADIAGGVATTRDLDVASQYFRVTGSGTANLVTKALDYHIVATILKPPPSSQGAQLSPFTLAAIPVAIGGTLSDPTVRPDLQQIVKSKLGEEVQAGVKNKLQGLFGR